MTTGQNWIANLLRRHQIEGLLLALALLALPTLACARPEMTKWDKDHPLPAHLGPFALSASHPPAKGDDDFTVLHVTDPQGHKADLKIEIAFDDVFASLGVGRIDPDSPRPQLLVTSYTGGAHCCVHIQILDFIDNCWRIVDVGTFDGEPFSVFPKDIDGDRITDIQHWDDRFAYAFGCYAGSWMPPRVFNLRGGEVHDVSSAPRYRLLYVKDYREAKKRCLKHQNAACAGLVADGYRLGRANVAWAVAMANVDHNDSWDPPGCKVKPLKGRCPENQEFHTDEYRQALLQFLINNGIAPPPNSPPSS